MNVHMHSHIHTRARRVRNGTLSKKDPHKCTQARLPPLENSSIRHVATISRLLKIVGFFCKRALKKRLYSAKETCNFMEPTNRSHRPVSLFRTTMHTQIHTGPRRKYTHDAHIDIHRPFSFPRISFVSDTYAHIDTHWPKSSIDT